MRKDQGDEQIVETDPQVIQIIVFRHDLRLQPYRKRIVSHKRGLFQRCEVGLTLENHLMWCLTLTL